MVRQVFIGPIIHTDENGNLIVKEKVVIYVEDGVIIEVKESTTMDSQDIDGYNADKINYLCYGQFMIPGFIDCHTHAVQFPNLGFGYDKCLLDWLETYTFPLEKKFRDTKFAEQVFGAVVKRTLEAGTTTASYFASLYTEASVILAKKTAELGQRAFIGKINMNTPRNDGYYESMEKSINDTMTFIESVERLGNPLVRPIISPRFALSCNMELMKKLVKIAKAKDLRIQSHISENTDEIKAVLQMYEGYLSYAEVYDAAGLLTNKTILAHGVHLQDRELAILEIRGTAIIHCPSSNTNLKSGFCDVRDLKAKNIKVGLGTDVSGGSSYSILNEMRSVLHVSNTFTMADWDRLEPLNYKDAFHMATLGGAKALSIDNEVGNLVPGKEFDALIIDLNARNSLLDDFTCNDFKEYTLEEKLQKFIYSGDDRNIVSVYVKGRKVKG